MILETKIIAARQQTSYQSMIEVKSNLLPNGYMIAATQNAEASTGPMVAIATLS